MVAMERHDQRAVRDRAGIDLPPQRNAAFAEVSNHGFGAFLLATKREHGAGIKAARLGEGLGRLLVKGDGVTASGEHERLPQPNYARPADGDGVGLARHQSPRATPSRRGSAPPSSPSGVTAMMCSPLVKATRRTLWPMESKAAARPSQADPGSSRTASSAPPKLTSALAAAASSPQSMSATIALTLKRMIAGPPGLPST